MTFGTGVDKPSDGVLTDEQVTVLGWREHQLLQRDVPLADARVLALDTTIDLHRMVDLLDGGCPPHLLRSIVA